MARLTMRSGGSTPIAFASAIATNAVPLTKLIESEVGWLAW